MPGAARFAALGLALGLLAAGMAPAPALAQAPASEPAQAGDRQPDPTRILVLDTERLFVDSAPGRAFLERYNTEREALIASNRTVEEELRQEEQELTQKRLQLSPEAFRKLADAFDEKVREIREQSEQASRDLERRRDQAPFLLLRQAETVLFEIMRDTGGAVILDARQVLVRSDAVDITELAIARVNEAMESQTVDDGQAQELPEAGDEDTQHRGQQPAE
ncbi:OmpH family outer membrane protein [Roseovarius nubinhibens]|uniref:OmpH family outer membrane protein n=1 Tax=Roseovarius nubinhibens TaxID=314263 RepID=UPI001C09D3AD|nr:OmpH family outer membrane protein [Roseovarius nubinhibens]MBU3001602.1 OmpH family outer membrane protein [Roseovarius nubinhibens]